MLLSPRTYQLAQRAGTLRAESDRVPGTDSFFHVIPSRRERQEELQSARRMLLLHQRGSVRVGEVVRYTITYTPSTDRILPTPTQLHLKIRNTSAIPLRAAYLHGPYTLHVAAYPSSFNPHVKVEDPKRSGVPEFEPNLKAGGIWTAKLIIPEDIRLSGHDARGHKRLGSGNGPYSPDQPLSPRWAGDARSPGLETETSVTWVVEVTSQVIFSQSASVGFEILLGRDERSVEMGITTAVGGHAQKANDGPGEVHDHQQGRNKKHHSASRRGVYSRAIDLLVEDTNALWNKPELPEFDERPKSSDKFIRKSLENVRSRKDGGRKSSVDNKKSIDIKNVDEKKQQKVHLVILTHGMHSNLGADMLYIKESIDATVKQARERRRKRKQADAKGENSLADEQAEPNLDRPATAVSSGGQQELDGDGDSDEEAVVVRGYPGNAVRTERGIQYLGKRLAKYVLNTTFPDQPYRPVKKSVSKRFTSTFTSTKTDGPTTEDGVPSHGHSSVHHEDTRKELRAYRYTSISFIGHSLGGLVQTYAIAYIQKHSPTFFEAIRPVNFVAMASPMLGLSNENPMYVKFALDFGLVGRTGQDLGLTWRAPNIARSGWSAVVSGLSNNRDAPAKQEDPGAKPLLRILPAGPAHQVLKMFRNRTIYSNVVNDGIVPLRTSCLLFLDWKGLGRVEKARRENGLIGTMAGWGWREMTGQNSSSPNVPGLARSKSSSEEAPSKDNASGETSSWPDDNPDGTEGNEVPQPPTDITNEDEISQQRATEQARGQLSRRQSSIGDNQNNHSALSGFLNLFRPGSNSERKQAKMFNRSQTIQSSSSVSSGNDESSQDTGQSNTDTSTSAVTSNLKRPSASRLESVPQPDASDRLAPPPRTTFLESAGDLLAPPIPPHSWITDPFSRSVTIFHDRVYHPEDIPPAPLPRPRSSRLGSSFSPPRANTTDLERGDMTSSQSSSGGMRVEEKIARAYHRDLSWRKVLVSLEPDAHNNMVVRRTFANAYGWPVVKHLCDTHFADTYTAETHDAVEPRAWDRAVSNDNVLSPASNVSSAGDGSGTATPKARAVSDLPEGQEVRDQLATAPPSDLPQRNPQGEGSDGLAPLRSEGDTGAPTIPPLISREDSALWDDLYFEGTTDSDSDEDDSGKLNAKARNQNERAISPSGRLARLFLPGQSAQKPSSPTSSGTDQAEIAAFLSASPASATAGSDAGPAEILEARRGLGMVKTPTSPRSPTASKTPIVAGSSHGRNASAGSSGGTTGIGLQKSVEEQTSPKRNSERSRPGTSGSGVVEDVVTRAQGGIGGV